MNTFEYWRIAMEGLGWAMSVVGVIFLLVLFSARAWDMLQDWRSPRRRR